MSTESLPGLGVARARERVAVPGSVIEEVLSPSSPAEVSAVVRAAAEDRTGLLLMGGRTRLDIANPAPLVRLGLSLGGLSGIDEFVPDEGVLHVAAGTPLLEIREHVQKEGWELPLDSPGPSATVGGTISSAVIGPRAHAFGTVSDAILGLDVIGGDGVASKCGGRVVKNVTGYDMAKLYCGSYGSLAIVTGAWLRLRPRAEQIETYRIEQPFSAEAFESMRSLAGLPSIRAIVWSETSGNESCEVLIELGSSIQGVAHDRATLEAKYSLERVESDQIDLLRDRRVVARGIEKGAADRGGDEVAIRLRVLGSRCEKFRRVVVDAGLDVSVDLGLGVIHARGVLSNMETLLSLRSQAEGSGGLATFERIPDRWRGDVNVFGSFGGSESLVEGLKAKFDPAGILNPGRYVSSAELRSAGGVP